MKDERKIDFKRHTSPPVSKMYLFKIIFYVVMLGVLSYFLFRTNPSKEKVDSKDITEITNIQLGQ